MLPHPQGRAPKNVSLCAKAFLLLRFWPPPRGWLLGTTCFPMAQDAYLCQRSGWKGKSIFMGRKHTATETSTHLHTHKQIMSHRSPVERTEEKLKVCRGLAFWYPSKRNSTICIRYGTRKKYLIGVFDYDKGLSRKDDISRTENRLGSSFGIWSLKYFRNTLLK